MPEKPLTDTLENGASPAYEDGLLEDRLDKYGSMRRSILKSLLALGILPFAKYGETKEKAKSILPEGVHIDSMEDLERLVEALEPAIQEDFVVQDRETEKFRQETGDSKAKAAPLNGETFIASIEDLAERIEHMINPKGVMERMDQAIDNRYKKAAGGTMGSLDSKNVLLEYSRASQLGDLFATNKVIRWGDFWDRVDDYDATVGAKGNRIPPASNAPEISSDDLTNPESLHQRRIAYLIRMTKGYSTINEAVNTFHHKNPTRWGFIARKLIMDTFNKFMPDYKPKSSLVSLQ